MSTWAPVWPTSVVTQCVCVWSGISAVFFFFSLNPLSRYLKALRSPRWLYPPYLSRLTCPDLLQTWKSDFERKKSAKILEDNAWGNKTKKRKKGGGGRRRGSTLSIFPLSFLLLNGYLVWRRYFSENFPCAKLKKRNNPTRTGWLWSSMPRAFLVKKANVSPGKRNWSELPDHERGDVYIPGESAAAVMSHVRCFMNATGDSKRVTRCLYAQIGGCFRRGFGSDRECWCRCRCGRWCTEGVRSLDANNGNPGGAPGEPSGSATALLIFVCA